MDELRARLTESPAHVLNQAATNLNVSPDEVVNRAFDTERGTELLADILIGSARTLNEAKIRGFARALANGLLGDDAETNDNQLVARALGELEEPHIRLLGRVFEASADGAEPMSMRTLEAMANSSSASAMVATLERVGILRVDDWNERQAQARQVSKALADQKQVDRRVQRNSALDGVRGVAQSPVVQAIRVDTNWVLSEFGRVCWSYLAGIEVEPASD
jgi:hypothetical protein